jgi:hypothetical protein
MDALVVAHESRRVNFIVDADIRSFFDTVDQTWLIRFVEHRIGDQRIIRLIRKWRMHQSIPEQGKWLGQIVGGYFNYHAVPTNMDALVKFRYNVAGRWRRTLPRRSQTSRITWAKVWKLVNDFPPKPRILHPWPDQRFAVKTQGGSRMLVWARTVLCGGRSVMGVPTAIPMCYAPCIGLNRTFGVTPKSTVTACLLV